jgi:dihydroorotase
LEEKKMEQRLKGNNYRGILLKGGAIIDTKTEKTFRGDVLVLGSIVSAIDDNIEGMDDKSILTLDVTDKIVAPGLVDMHVHLREPGREDKETILTGARAAVAGGFTAVACMPNTCPPLDGEEKINFILDRAKQAGFAKVYPVGTITKGREGRELAEMGHMARAGAVGFSDDGSPVLNSGIMRCALEYSSMFNLPILSHAEDTTLTANGVINEGAVSTKLGLKGIPDISEDIMVYRDAALLALTPGRLHVCHVSTGGSLEIIRQAKDRGRLITCEATPHHLVMTDAELCEYDSNFKMNPPLRSRKNVEALQCGLADGTIDCIASDHAPHLPDEKEVELELAPFGVIGLETMVGVVFTELVNKGKLPVARAIRLLSLGPCEVLNCEGGYLAVNSSADITVIDPELEWTVDASKFESRSANTPFQGWKLKGRAVITIVNGRVVMMNGTCYAPGK